MVKSSDYTRDLTKKEIKDLQAKYTPLLNRSIRSGFLPTEMKKRLLHITNWKDDTSNQEIYQFFSDIREHAFTGLMDLQLICDTLNEKELQRIFGTKPYVAADYPITKVLNSLLPSTTFRLKKKEKEEIQKKQEWRKYILDEVVVEGLDWYVNSGLFKTDIHRRMLIDTMDAVTVMSTGDKRIIRNRPDSYNKIVW